MLVCYILFFGNQVAVYKAQLFANLRGEAKKVLEIGIGTGPNLEYYTGDTDVQIFGVDPNKKMEKYARAAAVAAGLPVENFKFVQAVCALLISHGLLTFVAEIEFNTMVFYFYVPLS